jgi:predicted RNA binding protein YcfA (HicA-like mRNA interferase family)
MFVMGAEKTLARLLSGTADAAIRFDDLCQLLEGLGFEKRVRGSHHLFRKDGVEERINLQRAGTNAKPYQLKQVRAVILKSKLGSKQ